MKWALLRCGGLNPFPIGRLFGIDQRGHVNLGIDRAYVSGLELGQRNPTIVTLWHIGQALGVKLRSFFENEKPRKRA
jgi:transcriptional regulator with XRE-family HTH domain